MGFVSLILGFLITLCQLKLLIFLFDGAKIIGNHEQKMSAFIFSMVIKGACDIFLGLNREEFKLLYERISNKRESDLLWFKIESITTMCFLAATSFMVLLSILYCCFTYDCNYSKNHMNGIFLLIELSAIIVSISYLIKFQKSLNVYHLGFVNR